MQADVRTDLATSSDSFVNIVWPVISDWCGGGEIIPVESINSNGINARLDMNAGIDFWQVHPKTGNMRGIASRVQPTHQSFDSFTIRYARDTGAITEYEKRLAAIRETRRGWLYPTLWVHAYVSGDALLSVGMTRTCELFDYIESGVEGIDWSYQRTGNARFIVVWWDDYRRAGRQINTYQHGLDDAW